MNSLNENTLLGFLMVVKIALPNILKITIDFSEFQQQMKNKPLTKQQRSDIIDAWTLTNVLCAYLTDKKELTGHFTEKFDPLIRCGEIYRLLSRVVEKIDDSDLK
jgi:hypothetical protein